MPPTRTQFLIVQRYGRVVSGAAINHCAKLSAAGRASTKSTQLWTIRDIFAEASREEHAIPHVDCPLRPELVYGQPIAELERELFERLDKAKETIPSRTGRPIERSIRADRQVLLSVVASYPTAIASMTDQDWASAESWREANVKYLQHWLGDDLKTIVAHVDEDQYHLHAYAYDRSFRRELHPGHAAQNAAPKDVKGARSRAFKTAMSKLLDDYHHHVGRHFDMARIGPDGGRPRTDYRTAKMVAGLRGERDELQSTTETLSAQLVAADHARKQAEVEKVAIAAKAADAARIAEAAAAEKARLAAELAMTTEDRDNILAGGDDLILQLKTAKSGRAAAEQARDVAEARITELEQTLNGERIRRQTAESQRGTNAADTEHERQVASRIHTQLTKTQDDLAKLQRDHNHLLRLREDDQVTIAELRAIIEKLKGTGGGGAVLPKAVPATTTPIDAGSRPSTPWAPPKPQRIGIAGAVEVAKTIAAPPAPGKLAVAPGVKEQVQGPRTAIRLPEER